MTYDPVLNGDSGLVAREKINALGRSVAPRSQAETIVMRLIGADMTSLDDQAFELMPGVEAALYIPLRVIAMRPVGNLNLAAGGIFNAPGKVAPAFVPSNQAWSALSAPNRILQPSASIIGQLLMPYAPLYLSLHTPASDPTARCDIYVYGLLDPENG